jgi:hypothetical protein
MILGIIMKEAKIVVFKIYFPFLQKWFTTTYILIILNGKVKKKREITKNDKVKL